jgi:chemotaxis protein methyltransferase CheR
VTVTEVFRDPSAYLAVREHVLPYLRTYPFVKIWLAGCATGEEVYSLAIMLEEEGLLGRSQIYATDINGESLAKAKQGIFDISPFQDYTRNYQLAGGKKSFSDYYHSKYGSAIMRDFLRKNIVFSTHNLATDSAFGEMHLVICRNVLIYFDQTLQDRALGLFHNSLVPSGFLWLGTKESLNFSKMSAEFQRACPGENLFRLKHPSLSLSRNQGGLSKDG